MAHLFFSIFPSDVYTLNPAKLPLLCWRQFCQNDQWALHLCIIESISLCLIKWMDNKLLWYLYKKSCFACHPQRGQSSGAPAGFQAVVHTALPEVRWCWEVTVVEVTSCWFISALRSVSAPAPSWCGQVSSDVALQQFNDHPRSLRFQIWCGMNIKWN